MLQRIVRTKRRFSSARVWVAGLYLLGLVGSVLAQGAGEGPLQIGRSERRALLEEEAHAIQRERSSQARIIDDLLARSEQLQLGDVTQESIAALQRELERVSLRGEDLRLAMDNSRRRLESLQATARSLESRLQLLRNPAQGQDSEAEAGGTLSQTEQELAQVQESLELEALQQRNQQQWSEINNERQRVLESLLARRQELYQQQLESQRVAAQNELAGQLRQQQRNLLNRTLRLQERLAGREELPPAQRRLLLTQLRDAEERASLLQLDIRLAALEADLRTPRALLDDTQAVPRQLEEAQQRLAASREELKQVNELLERKQVLLQEDIVQVREREPLVWEEIRIALEQEDLLQDLLTLLGERQQTVQRLAEEASELEEQLQSRFNELISSRLFSRQRWPQDRATWSRLFQALSHSPGALGHQVRLSAQSLTRVLSDAQTSVGVAFGLLGLVFLAAVVALQRTLGPALEVRRGHCQQESSFTAYTVLSVVLLLRRNLSWLALVGFIGLMLWVLAVPWPGVGILATLLGVVLVTRVLVEVARLFLVSGELPIKARPALYRDVWLALVVLAVVTVLVILARLSALAEPVVAFYDRLFMVFLLVILIPLVKIRRLGIAALEQRFAERSWFTPLRVLSLVFPVGVLMAAVLGLAGYILLAWTLGWHLMVLIVVIAGWLLMRGLLDDFTAYMKNWVMMHTRYGLLWTQDVINPTRRLVGVLLALSVLALLLHLFEWEPNSPLLGEVWQLSETPLGTVGGTSITPRAVVVAVVLIWIVLGIARWMRNITYRWIFSGVIDLGVRNSLSVFTQYAVVVMGFLVALHTLGLNLSSLALFAGAVGVGIGFGLQTIANNFISGLLLLIERPLRSGDTVQIGNNLGTIERIGIRSLTMKTWDSTDVIIPNADVISNAFTNWTHSDNIIRTIFYVPVPVDCDPHQAGRLMREVLEGNSEVLRDPEPLVLLWEFGKSAITFRVQYYTDFFQSHMLVVQSDILYGIYDQLHAAGIPIQIHEQGLRVRGEFLPLKLSSDTDSEGHHGG